MKKFKMYTKQEITDAVKFILMVTTSVLGFFSFYASLWINFNLPAEWYVVPITVVLAILSEFGLCRWIYKG